MKYFFATTVFIFSLLNFIVVAPVPVNAELKWDGLSVTCVGDGKTPLYTGVPDGERECTYGDLILLIKDVIEYMMILSVPIIAIAAAYIGIRLILSQGNPAERTRAKQMAWDVMWGFIFIMSAFLIVYTITSVLDPRFNQHILQ